jgi:hypothetical protein
MSFTEKKPLRFFFSLFGATIRATLDEGPRSSNQWIQAILLVESFKLVPRPLNEGPRPKKLSIEIIQNVAYDNLMIFNMWTSYFHNISFHYFEDYLMMKLNLG